MFRFVLSSCGTESQEFLNPLANMSQSIRNNEIKLVIILLAFWLVKSLHFKISLNHKT